MKQVMIRKGQAVVEDVPSPRVDAGCVLVDVAASCVSAGTEMSGVRNSGLPLWKRVVQQPDNVKKALEMAASQGFKRTWDVVQGKLAAGNATGYSAVGTVIAVGEGVEDMVPGDRVACAGAQCAHHAEVIRVPRNLAVRLPDGLGWHAASTVTLGAIALQGVRRAQPTLGETFVVIGMGLLGQLTSQILKAAGCRVIGTDLDRERLALAKRLGADVTLHPDEGTDFDQVARLTDGWGADGVIITAASPSDAIVSTAFKMCRKKGRVVLVGDVGLNLNRGDFYQKEIDFLISSSYGPGRYDNRYEEEGLDYPISYVRWTENRNMAAYLNLLADGKVNVAELVSGVYPVERAQEAYTALGSPEKKPLMVLIEYPETDARANRRDLKPTSTARKDGPVRLALWGAGSFAKGMHLPNIEKMTNEFHLRAVCTRTGHNSLAVAKQFSMDYACTDEAEILRDPNVDAVIISTRHHQHAEQALAALKAGKHVLLEKPLALTRAELAAIKAFYATGTDAKPMLMTGFNRRFSPHARALKAAAANRAAPMILNYRMNAGFIPQDHWIQGAEGGGRNRGEACHIYDLFTYLTGARVTAVGAQAIHSATQATKANENFVATLSFDDGSVANLTYTASGAKAYPKEWLEVYVDGKTMVIQDYRELVGYGCKLGFSGSAQTQDKGHRFELEAFARAIRSGGEWPIPLWEQIQATEIACDVEDLIVPSSTLNEDTEVCAESSVH